MNHTHLARAPYSPVPESSSRSAAVDEHLHVVAAAAADFQEMPDLAVTVAQAAKLWNADEATCREVLTGLTRAGLLRRSADRYLRR